MSAQIEIDKKALSKFSEFMSVTLEKEVEKAYARTLRLLGSGCTRTVKKRLSHRNDGALKEMVTAGIDFAPQKALRIQRLKPMRIAIGVNGFKTLVQKKAFPTKPFVIRWMTKKGHHMKYLVQRATHRVPDRNFKNTTPLRTLFASHEDTFRKKIKQQRVFNGLVEQYMNEHHDKVLMRQIDMALARGKK